MIEIERKFLVTSDKYRTAESIRICQGYVCSADNRVVRVRTKGDKGYLTLKNATVGFARNEYEYEIPLADAEEMLETMCRKPIIEKRRYLYRYEGHLWEIDEFHGAHEGLVVAEIELEKIDEAFEKPEFIGEEVTGNPKYYNSNL